MRLFPINSSREVKNDEAVVYLNVYDLTPVNDYLYWVGFGIFHSGIEVVLGTLKVIMVNVIRIDWRN
ncbi:putative PPPDE peptidase domain-containing protein [Helianthus debilis subsp. tardiflorus]